MSFWGDFKVISRQASEEEELMWKNYHEEQMRGIDEIIAEDRMYVKNKVKEYECTNLDLSVEEYNKLLYLDQVSYWTYKFHKMNVGLRYNLPYDCEQEKRKGYHFYLEIYFPDM